MDDADASLDLSTRSTWYADADADGYGDPASATDACAQPSSHVADSSDCDDTDAAVNPGATEVCDPDGTDEDCDGVADSDDPSVSGAPLTGWPDSDADGYGDSSSASRGFCGTSLPSSHVDNDDDCDDSDGRVNPDATEECWDAVDNDCDGTTDPDCFDESLAGTTLQPQTTNDYLGFAVAIGDHDGDGVDDLATAAWQSYSAGASYGELYLLQGPVSSGTHTITSEADLIVTGPSTGSYLGYSVDVAQDMNGDGYDELVGGAMAWSSKAGHVTVVYGPTTGTLGAASGDLVIEGASGARLGWFEARSVGDLDDDGFADLAAGAPAYSSYAGAVFIYSGLTTGTVAYDAADYAITGQAASDSLGTNLEAERDLDGDGIDDIVLGCGEVDEVYIFYGPLTADADTSSADLTIASSGDELGDEVSAGDFDDDGVVDLAVGAPTAAETAVDGGAVYVFAGPLSGTLSTSDAVFTLTNAEGATYMGDRFGDLHGDDLDGDGIEDLLVGARYLTLLSSYDGVVSVMLGPLSGTADVADGDLIFASSSGELANTLDVGDLDDDGLPDLLVGAYQYSTPYVDGAVFVFYGSQL